jgi:hypothetical protein
LEKNVNGELVFEERQFLGYNKYSVIRRMSFAIFCFLAYYFSGHEKVANSIVGKMADIQNTGDLFFLMGILILVWSTVLIFILHIKTQLYKGFLIIDGLWTSRRVKIDLRNVRKVRIVKYSKYLLNRPVYNLHRQGKIRFFTQGNHAIELTDQDNLIYIIGSQHPNHLMEAIEGQITKAS